MKSGYFDPKTTKFPYTEYTDGHYLVVKKNNGIKFDADYPYIDESKKFLRSRAWTRFLLKTIVFPMTRVKMGLRIENRKNLKIFANESLPMRERIEDLTIRSHRAVCELSVIEPDKNVYPPILDNNRRIDE